MGSPFDAVPLVCRYSSSTAALSRLGAMSLHRSREGRPGFRLCALLIRIILLGGSIQSVHTYIYIYIANGVSLLLFVSGIVFIIFASYVLCCFWGGFLFSLHLFCLSPFCCFLFIGVQSTLPSIQAGLLTSTSFLCWCCFYTPGAAISL